MTVSELEDALLNKEFILHHQPQIDIESASLSSVEALVRWQHREYGLIYPDQFISLAEENGLISDMTGQIIKQTVEQTLIWKAENLIIQVSVNISAVTIASLKGCPSIKTR
ncbi:MAG: EAL domain-containing protein [Gammaproteobacteria bacterium]|nr:EAL domain-containing protein [Gammaproteobacteria bacterium]